MIESGGVPGKGGIRASILKLFPRVPEIGRIYESTEKTVASGRVPGKGIIRASVKKLSRPVPEKGLIC